MDAAGELLAALHQLVEIRDAQAKKGDRSRSRSSKRTVQRPKAKQLLRDLLTAERAMRVCEVGGFNKKRERCRPWITLWPACRTPSFRG